MKAWAKTLDPEEKSGLRFLGDPSSAFTSALEVGFENIPIFGGIRSKRYAIEIQDGIIRAVHIEPDNTGVDGEFPHVQISLTNVLSLECEESSWMNVMEAC